MSNETQVTGPEAPNQYVIDQVESVLRRSIEICADFYHGCDLAEDAINIAKLVICTGEEDEDTAQRILMSMGYLIWLVADWKGLTPETVAKAEKIRNLVFPDLEFED
jgi:hypothetical protein